MEISVWAQEGSQKSPSLSCHMWTCCTNVPSSLGQSSFQMGLGKMEKAVLWFDHLKLELEKMDKREERDHPACCQHAVLKHLWWHGGLQTVVKRGEERMLQRRKLFGDAFLPSFSHSGTSSQFKHFNEIYEFIEFWKSLHSVFTFILQNVSTFWLFSCNLLSLFCNFLLMCFRTGHPCTLPLFTCLH